MEFAVGDLIGWKFVGDRSFRSYCVIKNMRREADLWGDWETTPERAIKKYEESRNTLGSSYINPFSTGVIVKIIKKGAGIRITNWKAILKKP